jgi:hypothetical protein
MAVPFPLALRWSQLGPVGATWYRARGTLRRQWRGWVAVAVVLGLSGGVALAALAGARRTASAFPRVLRWSHPSQLAVDLGPYDPRLVATLSQFAEVNRTRTYVALYALPFVDGQYDQRYLDVETVGSLDGLYFDQDKIAITSGRAALASRDDEMVVNENAARAHHLRVGQRMELAFVTPAAAQDPSTLAHPAPLLRKSVVIVGIGEFNDEVVQDDADRSHRFLLTPALTAEAAGSVGYAWTGLQVRHGSDVASVKARYLAMLPPDAPRFLHVASVIEAQAQRAVRPEALALGVFGALAALAALLLTGLAILRNLRNDRDDLAVLRSLGAGPWLTSTASLPLAFLAIAVGSLLSVGVALALSPLSPIGPVRRVEVHPGVNADWAALALGGALLAGSLAGLAIVAAVNQAPHRLLARARLRPSGRSNALRAAATAGLPVAAVAGIRMAFEPGEGRSSAPVRSTILGATVAVVALTGALCFSTSLRQLVHHPRLYGWNWNVALYDNGGYGNLNTAALHTLLDHDPEVAQWAGGWFGSLELDGHNVAALGLDLPSALAPPLLSGRALRSDNEVILGPATLSQLGKREGQTVNLGAGTATRKLKIVGTATFPTIGINHGTHTSLGDGALLSAAQIPGLTRKAPAALAGPNVAFVRYRPGTAATVTATTGRILNAGDAVGDGPGSVELLGVQRPAEIVNYTSMGAAPALLAGALGLAVLLALGLTLASAVRRRRHDLALLKVLGFTRAQVAATVTWQATITAGLGVVVGIPVGVALGRWLWIGFARSVHVVPSPTIPVSALALVAAGVVVLANVVAAFPARTAARTPAATLLRTP